ncbi:MAG TPA: hypothetical protein PKA83_04410 [Pirellulaceae bacterium]|nr:hypothetical protein [Pirellulaceae bacterium]
MKKDFGCGPFWVAAISEKCRFFDLSHRIEWPANMQHALCISMAA